MSCQVPPFPSSFPLYSSVIRIALPPRPRIPQIQLGGHTLKTVSCMHSRFNIINVPYISLLDASNPNSLIALETIPTVSSTVPTPSYSTAGRKIKIVIWPWLEPPEGDWVRRGLPERSSSTFYELFHVLDAVSLLCQRGLNIIVIWDSQSALHALISFNPAAVR